MVKLASVRESRMYGPPGVRDAAEYVNAFAYVVATILLLAGICMLLPGKNYVIGHILLLISLAIIVLVNLHDLYAQLSGFDFHLPLVTHDPQLAFIEVAAPLLQAVGGILFFIGIMFLLGSPHDKFGYGDRTALANHAYRLLIAGPAFWLGGSILNAFQVYEKTSAQVQAWQNAVSIPFLIASSLLFSSGFYLNIHGGYWSDMRKITVNYVATSIVACALLLVAALVNVIRVYQLQRVEREGGPLEKLRGGAWERLEQERTLRVPFLVQARTAVYSTYS